MTNLLTGETCDIAARPLAEDPMQMAARMVQDDLAIMIEGDDGQYYLQAGAILLAGFWRLEDKFGMPLSEIHTSGDVPQFREKLEKGMMNFFRRIKPENPVLRNNYFIQVDEELAWSSSIGSEDADGIGWYTAEKNKAIEHHYFRSERQSLRRYVFTVLLVRWCSILIVFDTAFLALVVLSLQYARTSTRSRTFAKSRMFLAVWPRQSVVGVMMSPSIKARSDMVRCCSNILTRSMRSRWREDWT